MSVPGLQVSLKFIPNLRVKSQDSLFYDRLSGGPELHPAVHNIPI
jgi:hypothetical protein